MIEAVMFWNEPNNKSHWDFEIDPDWSAFAAMVRAGGRRRSRAEARSVVRVLGGISPIDPDFLRNMDEQGVPRLRRRGRRPRLPARLEPLDGPRVARQARARSAR